VQIEIAPAARRRRSRVLPRGWLYMIPAATASLVLIGYPVVYSLWMSAHDYSLQTGVARFVGLQNYVEALTSADFLGALRTTFALAIPALILELVLGMALALCLDRVQMKGRAVLVSLLLAPMMIPGSAAAMAFALLYVPQYGLLNALLTFVTRTPIDVQWLTTTTMAPWSVIIVEVWQKTSFVMLFLLAGLATIPDDIYEAAQVDGAAGLQTFRYITLPLLRSTILAVTAIRIIDLLKMFDIPFIMTNGGPGTATEPVSMFIIKTGFQFLRIGAGAAQSLVLFIIIGAVLLALFRLTSYGRGKQV
jgi:multiple sugar transport system permease protein